MEDKALVSVSEFSYLDLAVWYFLVFICISHISKEWDSHLSLLEQFMKQNNIWAFIRQLWNINILTNHLEVDHLTFQHKESAKSEI